MYHVTPARLYFCSKERQGTYRGMRHGKMGLLKFFRKYLPSGSRGSEDRHSPVSADAVKRVSPSDQRDYSRHWVSFPIIVYRVGSENGGEGEQTALRDISGGGALFVSQNPEYYYPGQMLKISIMLDGVGDVRARIRTEATVIRIHRGKGAGRSSGEAGIAVQFDRTFEFDRVDNQGVGSAG